MSRGTDVEHSANAAASGRMSAAGAARGWGVVVIAALLCTGPARAQTRVHNPNAQKPPASSNPTPPANSTPPANANSSTNSNSSTNPKPSGSQTTPSNQSSSPKPSAPTPAAAGLAAAGATRGMLVGLNLTAGTITLARNAYPPTTLHVSASATITRDGVPVHLGDLETGSSSAIPDHILVDTAGTAGGSPLVTQIKATSRDHFWYGHVTSIDPASSTLVVTSADGQRRAFQLNDRTNVTQFGAGNAPWSALHVSGLVEVDWIPGDSPSNAQVLQAHSVVLNKPYAGIQHPPAAGH